MEMRSRVKDISAFAGGPFRQLPEVERPLLSGNRIIAPVVDDALDIR